MNGLPMVDDADGRRGGEGVIGNSGFMFGSRGVRLEFRSTAWNQLADFWAWTLNL